MILRDATIRLAFSHPGLRGLLLPLLREAKSQGEKAEPKDIKRIEDMVAKSNGSDEKLLQLARNMAHAITDADKAHRRGLAAESEGQDDVAEIFFDRAKEIGYGD